MSALPLGTERLIRRAYDEDLGERGDVTTDATIDETHTSTARIVVREGGCIAGVDVVVECFRHIDPDLAFETHVADGDWVPPHTVAVTAKGATRSLLTAERVALNLFGRMCGIATATRRFVDQTRGTDAQISDTRKTTPGLRALEKAAVLAGGGTNHRFGLYDAVLIKDNHIAASGSIPESVRRARQSVGNDMTVEVEVDTLEQLAEVLTTDSDAVLLDNMNPSELKKAVDLVGGRMTTEASGGVTIDTVAEIAHTGVDIISTGWLTHSSPALDVALDLTAD